MRILITGAAGMIGRKLTERLLVDGRLAGKEIEHVDLVDVVAARESDQGAASASPPCDVLISDLAAEGVPGDLASREPDVVFHLAGVVSGEAEADFAKGMRVNVDATRRLFDALADLPGTPRVVFTSSIAVYGAPFPDPIPDDFQLTPLTSYGMEKLVGEALLADYSRRGFFDGVGIRLPTITVRPGAPNAAASGFFSSIIREPLAGQRARLPVGRDVRHPHASPRSAVGFLIHAAELDTGPLGARRNITMPSVSVTVGEQIEALARIAGPATAALIEEVEDPTVARIVAGWPRRFDARRARELGFSSETTFDEIVHAHLDDVRSLG